MQFLRFVKVPNWRLPTIRSGNGSGCMLTMQRRTSRTCFHVCAVTGDQSTSNAFSAKFPSDYTELIMQVIPVKTCSLTTAPQCAGAFDAVPVLHSDISLFA
jgi:hypothetical protein